MDGALIIDKPAGFTSHDVVARVRKIIRERRVGHTGTLDPFATGVLVILVGRATRLAQFLSGAEKEYEGLIRLGYATDTGDATGQPIANEIRTQPPGAQSLHQEEIETAMASLRGEIEQTPPMYSAKKIAGRKLYEFARRGEEIERQPVRVTISEFELIPLDKEASHTRVDGTIDLKVRVACSAGTYIRRLAEDLGNKIGVPAHLAELRRTGAGRFGIQDAITLEQLENAVKAGSITTHLITSHDALAHLPAIELDEEQARRTGHGIGLASEDAFNDGEHVRLSRQGQLIAVGRLAANVIQPKVVLGNQR